MDTIRNDNYLSGFTGEESFVLLTGKDHGAANYFITDSRYTEQAERWADIPSILDCEPDR